MSDLDTIREALQNLAGHRSCVDRGESCGYAGCRIALEALALLDGAVGLVREGDVLLSAKQAKDTAFVLRGQWANKEAREGALALLAAGRQEKP